jgi:hypothetical protein
LDQTLQTYPMLLGIALQKDLIVLNFSFFLYIFLTKKINPQHSTSHLLWKFEPTCSTLLHCYFTRCAPGEKPRAVKTCYLMPHACKSLTRKWIPWIRSLYFFQGFRVSKLFPCTVFDKEIGENKTLTWNLLPLVFFFGQFLSYSCQPIVKEPIQPNNLISC